jgi:hypothetical protein
VTTPPAPKPDDVALAREHILAAAHALLAGGLDALRAAEQIARWRSDLDPEQVDEELLHFAGIESETDRLLIQDSLRGWHPDAAQQKRREYEEAERFYRTEAEASARILVARYGRPA